MPWQLLLKLLGIWPQRRRTERIVMNNDFDFIDAIEMIVDMHKDRNVTIDFNNELITIEASQCDGCNNDEIITGQDDKEITHLGKNIGWII